ncbi:hypothetical protein DTO166G4_5016 [Paecilomyces variotii]|nr:hypothetical protein DTO166G4_5016 [Paecilomyces variotii]KAJ9240156.1 hypothetical protein DTO166G5_2021 [Paecilomyces variotii]
MEAYHRKPCCIGNDDEVQPSQCYFPSFGGLTGGNKRQMLTAVDLQHAQRLLVSGNSDSIPQTLRAAWALVLRCYTGSDNVCFGYEETAHLLDREGSSRSQKGGTCTTWFKLEDDMTLSTVVEYTKGLVSTEQSNHPSERDACLPAENTAYNTAFLLNNHTESPCYSTKCTILDSASVANGSEKTRVRIIVDLFSEGPKIFLEWSYPDIPPEFAANIAHVFDQVVGNILLNSQSTIGQMDLCTDRDMRQILNWNSECPQEVDRCVHQLIHDKVLVHPGKEAVCSWDGSFTYGELYELAVKVARQLAKLGVQQEISVALCFEKSRWNIVAMIGVLIAGGTFVSLDASHPSSRLQQMVETAGAQVILCSHKNVTIARALADCVLSLDNDWAERLPSSSDEANFSPSVTPKNAAYIIFTSGSTGAPKATVVEHRAYCSSAHIHGPRMLIGEDSRVLQFASHTFDSSLVESLTTLMQGGCVCIPNEEARVNDIASSINSMRVNHALLTPSYIDFVDAAAVPGLKSLVLMGEPMSPEHVTTWSNINLVNGYGPTESSVVAVVNSKVTAQTDCKDIGRPVGVRCWIVDPHNHDKLMPVGCTGELLLEGPTLARCYNDPQKTAESFIFDPKWSRDHTEEPRHRRFYKTGDLVRYNSTNGSLSFVGRKDTQIKVHGQRVELREIEHHISSSRYTKHGLVLFPDAGYCKGKIVAVLSLRDNLLEASEPKPAPLSPVKGKNYNVYAMQINQDLAKRLPLYMVPSMWLTKHK